MTPLDIHPMNPLRPPSWRGRRAAALSASRLRATRFDDDWIRRARRVLAAAARRGGDLGHPRVVAVHPAVAGAYRVRLGDARLRHELEARLLCGQPDSEVAGRVGLNWEIIAAYAALHFDVRDRLEAPDWVAACVFGARLFDGTGAGDEALAMLLVGYSFGVAGLDALLGHTDSGPDGAGLAAALRLFVAVATARVAEASARRWVALASRLAEVEAEGAASRAAAVSGAIVVPGRAAEMASIAGRSTGRAGPDATRRVHDERPLATSPSPLAEGLDDQLARRTA